MHDRTFSTGRSPRRKERWEVRDKIWVADGISRDTVN